MFSPPLDARGNSARGVQVCEALSRELGLHFLQPSPAASATVRARYTLASVRSKRRRQAAERRLLDAHGSRAVVYELQADLRFATIEPVLRDVVGAGDNLQFAVLDFKRVTHVDGPATRMLAWLVDGCAARGKHSLLMRMRRVEMLTGFGPELDPHTACSKAMGRRARRPRAPAWPSTA